MSITSSPKKQRNYMLVYSLHSPRGWFILPLKAVEQAITLIISGDVTNYRYDKENEIIIIKS